MTHVILKATFDDIQDEVIKELPIGARIRLVGTQNDRITIWFETTIEMMDQGAVAIDRTERRVFVIRGTGQPIPPRAEYLATVLLGVFVWHVFELIPA